MGTGAAWVRCGRCCPPWPTAPVTSWAASAGVGPSPRPRSRWCSRPPASSSRPWRRLAGCCSARAARPSAAVLAWGAASGLGSGTGNVALFRGLARGQMAVVAPTSAVVTVLVPAAVGLALGDRLSFAAWCGVGLSLPAVALTSWTGGAHGFSGSDLAYGGVAGLGFGWLFVALDRAGTGDGPWPLVPGQLVAVLLVLAVSWRACGRSYAVARRAALGRHRRLSRAGNQLFLASTATGPLPSPRSWRRSTPRSPCSWPSGSWRRRRVGCAGAGCSPVPRRWSWWSAASEVPRS